MTSLTGRFEQALILTARLHANHFRKGTRVPYLAHLLSVVGLVLEHGGNEDEAIAALLHDAVEDHPQKISFEDIRRAFGEAVVDIVEGCTDAKTFPKPPWRERKEAFIAHLSQASASERLVTAADKLHNARAILADYRELGDALWDRFNGGQAGTLWYYRALVSTLRSAGPTPIVEELDRVVLEIERLVLATDAERGSQADG